MSINSHDPHIFCSLQIEEVGKEACTGSAQAQVQANAEVQVANDSVCSGKGKESEFYKADLSFTQLLTVILSILLHSNPEIRVIYKILLLYIIYRSQSQMTLLFGCGETFMLLGSCL
jgi:hypothetical protein